MGKTHLAQRLCAVLPNALYAKLGHGRPKADKPPNLFRTQRELTAFLERRQESFEHIVLESNLHARRGRGDVIIFVDGFPGRTDFRKDAETLRVNSHIQISPGASVREWRKVLRARLNEPSLRKAVCEALMEQRRYLTSSGPSVRSKVWFVVNERRAFGPGLAYLLEGVQRLGTLSEAASEADMSYRYAWDLIRTAEERLGRKLVVRHPGGVGGGRSELSTEGRHLLHVFERVSNEVAAYADERFTLHYAKEAPHERH